MVIDIFILLVEIFERLNLHKSFVSTFVPKLTERRNLFRLETKKIKYYMRFSGLKTL